MIAKVFKTYNQQLRILRSRGLNVPTNGGPKRILEKENYYNLINGYKELFIDTPKTTTAEEQYKAGAHFYEIYALYKFDIELRLIFLKRILRVENNIKSAIAYEFSKKYGHDNYLQSSNFNQNPGSYRTSKKIVDLIQTISKLIIDQSSKHDSIKHYKSVHGYVPLWVLMNIMTFGKVSKFYDLMKQLDKQTISKKYNIHDNELSKILGVLTLCRNKCAHDERFYDFVSPKISIINNWVHNSMSIPVRQNGPIHGKKDLFACLIALRVLLNKSEISKMTKEINKSVDALSKKLDVISIDDIINKMGFPSNWIDISKI